MNLLEHYIEKIYSETEITEEFAKEIGHKPHERLFKLDMDISCYGHKERVKTILFESELKQAKENGYYMA